MALSTKGWVATAAGVVVVGAGGYVAAQAMVGNQVEQALVDSFAELDRSVSYEVHDVQIDKGLFDTRATATIAMRGFEDATADVNLFVKHGALSADITGELVPNQALVQGIIDIDLKATRSAIEGQLSAAELDGVALDVLIDQLVVGLDRGADGHWHLDTRAQEITYHGDNETVRMATPRLILNTRHHEGEPVLLQSLDIPRTEIFVEGVRVYLEGMESESESRGETIVHQSGHFRIAEMGVDDTSFGSLAFEVSADNWDLEALQAFQEAYAPLMAMHLDAEERGVPVDAEQERVLMAEALESSYAMLVASPTMAIDPLQAHIVLPDLGIDFKPRLTTHMAFDGQDLAKGALYGAFWPVGQPLPEGLMSEEQMMSPFEAQEYLSRRLSLALTVTTPPDLVLGFIPMPFAAMLDSEAEEQEVLWQEGSLMINGQPIM